MGFTKYSTEYSIERQEGNEEMTEEGRQTKIFKYKISEAIVWQVINNLGSQDLINNININ